MTTWFCSRRRAKFAMSAQYSIHRGQLQRILVDAVGKRLGQSAIKTGQRATRVNHVSERSLVDRAKLLRQP
jgi:hypothetical protein